MSMSDSRRMLMGLVVVSSMLAAAGCDHSVSGDGDDGAGGGGATTGSGPQTAAATTVAGGCDPDDQSSAITGTVGVGVGGGVGGDDGGAGGGSYSVVTVGAGVTTGGGSGERSAVSLLVSQLPPDTVWCEDQGPCPADMLVLFVDSNGNTCADPTGFPSNDAVTWRYAIGIPAALQQAGSIDLSSSDVTVLMERWETQPNSGAAATAGVGPGGTSGLLIIHEIDEDEVSFSLSGLDWDGDGNGSYTAERCDD